MEGRVARCFPVQQDQSALLALTGVYLCMCVCMGITNSRVWINRVRLPILLVVSGTGKINVSLSPFAPENLVSRERGLTVSSRVSPLILHTLLTINSINSISAESESTKKEGRTHSEGSCTADRPVGFVPAVGRIFHIKQAFRVELCRGLSVCRTWRTRLDYAIRNMAPLGGRGMEDGGGGTEDVKACRMRG